ncbi:MAG: hypothetical protein JSV22_12650 [Bacteroidales bacterium]|nr:MAG: hypothetical protein JSV22_12650 [Bacteroidales bacterium]
MKTNLRFQKKLYKTFLLLFAILLFSARLAITQDFSPKLYPYIYDSLPEIASPFTMDGNIETILVVTKSDQYGIVPVTMENGKPLLYSYKVGTHMGKDHQMHIDAGDFPDLAKTGLHSEDQLDTKEMITGIPIDVINCTGRPNAYSISGFMADDEDIISVLKGDNHLVRTMGLTHPQMAKPLFHIWNLILKEIELGNWGGRYYENIKHIYYNGNSLNFNVSGSKGWQISIFFDEVQGRYNIHIDRELTSDEEKYLAEKYSHLNDEEMAVLIHKLTNLDISEMLPYYIMRYGFYEGHTDDYRCDPIAIASIFGLRSIEEINNSFQGDLYNTLTRHFISK